MVIILCFSQKKNKNKPLKLAFLFQIQSHAWSLNGKH